MGTAMTYQTDTCYRQALLYPSYIFTVYYSLSSSVAIGALSWMGKSLIIFKKVSILENIIRKGVK